MFNTNDKERREKRQRIDLLYKSKRKKKRNAISLISFFVFPLVDEIRFDSAEGVE